MRITNPIKQTIIVTPGASDLGWRAALPDDLKNHELIKNFTKPGDAIRDYVTVKQEAAKMLKIPDDQAPEDVKNEFYAKLGIGKPRQI